MFRIDYVFSFFRQKKNWNIYKTRRALCRGFQGERVNYGMEYDNIYVGCIFETNATPQRFSSSFLPITGDANR
jgi:hypothetical protein